ncbi:MAG: proline--tRNA ligase [Atopobium minutum]|nr:MULTISPECIES: proline--tRNA ligase [Atopobium]MBS4873345.1 proline--tRNA ligase [Atopobium minutum]MDU5129440.1 proline--tRNA ligase [Atopobium minutum]MDU5357160.1 proline--tRNA ligase [Atopobium minutum]
MSKLYAPTLKEDPTDAELASHRLMLRAGLIRKGAAGLYSYLPLAWRSLLKIETIIREEMDEIDAQEMLVPILTDGDLWKQSGRWDVYGPEMMRMHDRHEHIYALGPTHEESFTDLVRNELRSYKQLPVTLYQIQDKFRDERRPRFGLMRGREFIMKDAYSFSADQESLQECYDQEKEAYAKICERIGLRALQVVADSGQIGGDTSVEFMALAEAGEAELVYCNDCGWAADVEAATAKVCLQSSGAGVLERVHTPQIYTIEDLAEQLGVPTSATVKALALVDQQNNNVVCLIPGDHELNDCKAEKYFGEYHFMTEEELAQAGLVRGFMGPVNLPETVTVYADSTLKDIEYWTVGANEPDYHFLHAQQGRDFTITNWVDLISAKADDLCPHCGAPLKSARGIEVAQVFQLGTKYSESMGATFMDVNGREKPLMMGSYGIGVSRALAAVIEQYHDAHGIFWPVSVAPYEVEVIPLDIQDEVVWPVATEIASELSKLGVDVLLDDRKERPGVKFADADLIGMPYQIICGKKAVVSGNVELKNRATGERSEVAISEIAGILAKLIEEQRR